ncbi:MAG: phenylalanine--tRNA ligase subunit beta, partial [Candidatus Hydrothermarchaeales archaeon]
MPVVDVYYSDLCSLLGKAVPLEELVDRIPMIGADIEDYNSTKISIEFFPDRPDLYSAEGIARALKSFLGYETGLKGYNLEKPETLLEADKSVIGVRDYVVACEVSGVELEDYLIQELMDLQEDLHWALGKDRKKVAIGVHDSSRIKGPSKYTTAKPGEISFIPLGMEEEMTLGEILKRHPKGVEYADTINIYDRYPLIVDSKGDVLSMPPIINGELTKVTENTTDFFVEMTGTDFTLLSKTLNILSTAFAERGWKIKPVEIKHPEMNTMTPDFTPSKRKITLDYVNRMLGLELTAKEVASCLLKMGFGVGVKGGELEVLIPCYRADILHEIDIVEDVAIGYGYENFIPELPKIMTTGEKHPVEKYCERIRDAMIGYGFTEVMTLMLTNEESNFSNINHSGEAVTIKNPISEEHTIIRTNLLSSLMEFLKLNKHKELPQKVFEVGDVVIPDKNTET